MKRWVDIVVRRRWLILAGSLLFVIVSGVLGASVADKLSSGGYDDPSSASARADAILTDRFHAGDPNLVLLVTTPGSVDAAAAAAAGSALTSRLAGESDVTSAESYWSAGRAPLLKDGTGHRALVLARVSGDADQVQDRVRALAPRYSGTIDGLDVRLGGSAEVAWELNQQTQKDLMKAEAIIAPITLIALVLVFGTLTAALLPMLIAAVAVVGTQLVLTGLAAVTDVSFLALNVTTGLGLGLAIDYSLLMVARFREGLESGATVPDALAVTVRTAGRSVLYSALTVAFSLAGLLVFKLYFLRSFAYAGIAVTALAALAALVVLPAVLAALGARVNRWRVLPRRLGSSAGAQFWPRWARGVQRRPVLSSVAALVVLVILGLPFLGLRLNLADDRALPPSAEGYRIAEAIRTTFSTEAADPLLVVVPSAGDDAELTRYATAVSALPDVDRVDSPVGSFGGGQRVAPPDARAQRFREPGGPAAYLSVVTAADSSSDRTGQLVDRIEATTFDGHEPLVTGTAARLGDTMHALRSGLPWAVGLIVVATLLMLAVMTGSVLIPVKALVLNVLSLSATFGAMVWVFQDGHAGWVVGDYVHTGAIVATVPVLTLCIAFGLSMDYEVFLLSRIKEEYGRGVGNTEAVVRGLTRTGRLITSAALLVAIVFASFLSSGVTYVKILGLGLALAVLMDATLIRSVLVPALMTLLGRANWWGPAWLGRLHARFAETDESAGETRPEKVVAGAAGG